MRLVYFGTPVDAVPPLEALVEAGHDVALVVTQPDRRRGRRGNELVASAVKVRAEALGLRVVTPEKAREVVDEVAALGADLGVVVAFGQLLPPALLAATKFGFVNVHFSLLPRWRGAAPVERAILAGDAETGVALMEMEQGLDTGGVYAERRIAIEANETAGELRERLVICGTELLVSEIASVPARTPVPQSGEPTYAHKLEVDEFRLDPAADAASLARVVRAGNPKPGAWCTVAGRRVKVLRAAVVDSPAATSTPGVIDGDTVMVCAHGGLRLDEVQPEGKRAMAATAWLAGLRGQGAAVVIDRVDG